MDAHIDMVDERLRACMSNFSFSFTKIKGHLLKGNGQRNSRGFKKGSYSLEDGNNKSRDRIFFLL